MLRDCLATHGTCKAVGVVLDTDPYTIQLRCDKYEIERPRRNHYGWMRCRFCGKRIKKRNVNQVSCKARPCLLARKRDLEARRRERAAAERIANEAQQWPREAYVNTHHRPFAEPDYREVRL